MIQKLKKIKLFLYICLGLIILNACTFEEEIIKQNGYQERMKLESKKFSELLKLPAFSNAYKRVINKKVTLSNDFAARTALEDQYGFTIVEGKDVKIITDIDGSIYYSMLIERAIKENLKFENLVIKVVDEDVFAYILKRELYEKATYTESNNSYDINVKDIILTELSVDNTTITSKVYSVRTWIAHCTDSGGPQDCHGNQRDDNWTPACGHYEYVVVATSDGIGGTPVVIGSTTGSEGGGSVNYSLGSSNNGTNQNGETPLTNNTPPIKNVIIVDDDVAVPIEKPCEALRRICDPSKSNVKIQINQLKNKVIENVQKEWGTSIQKIGPSTLGVNPPESQFSIQATPIIEGLVYDVDMTLGQTWIASAHIHTSLGEGMFSWKDIYNLLLQYNSVHHNRRKDVTQFVVVANPNNPNEPNVYAIKIDNLTLFQSKLDADLNNPLMKDPNNDVNKTYKNLNRSLEPFFKAYSSDEFAFLTRFSGYGISLYKAMDNNLSEWNKLERDSIDNPLTSGGIKSTPCLTQ